MQTMATGQIEPGGAADRASRGELQFDRTADANHVAMPQGNLLRWPAIHCQFTITSYEIPLAVPNDRRMLTRQVTQDRNVHRRSRRRLTQRDDIAGTHQEATDAV